MSAWHYFNPVNISFGAGEISKIGTLIKNRRYLLVTHPDAPMLPWIEQVKAAAGAPLAIINEIEPNPSLAMLERVCGKLDQANIVPEVIVALGGGSVIDSAKFLAAGHGQYQIVYDYLQSGSEITQTSLPIIAVPTTAGTGSDLTKWATIWDLEADRKLSLNRPDLYAEAIIIDPVITQSLPWSVTLASGLDALSHALESIWNINANPMTRHFAIAAARDILKALPRLQLDLNDTEARCQMALGATNAGLAFSNTQTALAHNISYPITLHYKLAHGIACSFCLPEVMRAAIGVSAVCDQAIVDIFGDLQKAPQTLRAFLNSLGAPARPEEVGIGKREWQNIVQAAFAGQRGQNFIGTIDKFPF